MRFLAQSALQAKFPKLPKSESIYNDSQFRKRKRQRGKYKQNFRLQLHFVFRISLPENVICFAQKQHVNKQTIITIYIALYMQKISDFYKVKISALDICVLQTRRVNLMEVMNRSCGKEDGRERGRGRGICIYLAIYR